MNKAELQRHFTLISQSWLAIVVLTFGMWLRLWQLESQGILFGDAAHDILAAQEAVAAGQLPLLGIESSVPRFKQGPLSVWFSMLVTLVTGGESITAYLFAFALIGCATLLLFYEYAYARMSKYSLLGATIVLALSPLAVAHARMPYHVAFLPLATLYFLWCAEKWLQQPKKSRAFFLAFSAAFAMQFELSVAPLILVAFFLVWVSYKRKMIASQKLISIWLTQVAGIALGLLPQILHDISHGFSQLGGFAIWVGYRSVATVYPSGHHWSLQKISILWDSIAQFGLRILSFDSILLALPALLLIGTGIKHILHLRRNKPWLELRIAKNEDWLLVLTLSTLALVAAYSIHGSPSEAYYPPFFIFLALWVGVGLEALREKHRVIPLLILLGASSMSAVSILQSRFFLDGSKFSYGMSVLEQQQIMRFIVQQSGGSYQLKTTVPEGSFANYFDNLRLVGKSLGHPENRLSQDSFYVEPKTHAAVTIFTLPGIVKTAEFQTTRVQYLQNDP